VKKGERGEGEKKKGGSAVKTRFEAHIVRSGVDQVKGPRTLGDKGRGVRGGESFE